MEANPRTLADLFSSQLRYVVPMFQRLYVWKKLPQWETLWEDIVEKADLQFQEVKTSPHYLGALIIEGVRPSSPREVKRFLVIDGQQRLTTLQLLLCAYRDLARKNGWVRLDRATTRSLENVDSDVMEDPDEEVFKVWPTTLNRDVFRAVVRAGSRAAVELAYPLVRLRRRRHPEPRSPLVEAYLHFSQAIEEWIARKVTETKRTGEECASVLLQSLQQDFCVVQIVLSEGDDSQEIFYSLNSQGRPLSQSDLLRSLIFMRAEKERLSRDEIFAEYWNRFETSFWSSEVKRGGHTYSHLDLALRFFLMAKTGKLVDARRVNEEYRRWVSADPPKYTNVKEELADFTRHATLFQRYEEASREQLPSTDLRRILVDFDVSTAMPLVLYLELEAELSQEQLADCLAMLESFLARRVFTGEDTKEYNKFFVEVVGGLRGVTVAGVQRELRGKLLSGTGSTRHWPTDSEVIEKAISRPVGDAVRTPALRLILERMENALRTKKSEEAEAPTNLQIEHVLPQYWSQHWTLKGQVVPADVVLYPFLAKDELKDLSEAIRQRNVQLQTLGNLTLLNTYLNPAASNRSFEMKLMEYRNSVLRLNRYFDNETTWDEESIRRRGAVMGELMCNVWPRPADASR